MSSFSETRIDPSTVIIDDRYDKELESMDNNCEKPCVTNQWTDDKNGKKKRKMGKP